MLLRPQFLYIYDLNGNVKVDYVGRFETIDKDYAVLSKKIGLQQALPKTNVSKRKKSFMEYYTNPKVVAKIQELYGKDFDLLGYDKAIVDADVSS